MAGENCDRCHGTSLGISVVPVGARHAQDFLVSAIGSELKALAI